MQPKAKADLHEIWQAETRDVASQALDHFLEKYQAKYDAACECLSKDRDVLLTFYDFPALDDLATTVFTEMPEGFVSRQAHLE